MVFKIHTSKRTMDLFSEMTASEGFQPFILSKLAIALSVKNEEPLSEDDFKTDSNGLELNRQTITGEYDMLFKALIEMYEDKHIDDDEYFTKYLKAHLDRGARALYAEHKYYGDSIISLVADTNGI